VAVCKNGVKAAQNIGKTMFLQAVRSIDTIFQGKMAQNPHGYCAQAIYRELK
jgi:hypothetical protein